MAEVALVAVNSESGSLLMGKRELHAWGGSLPFVRSRVVAQVWTCGSRPWLPAAK